MPEDDELPEPEVDQKVLFLKMRSLVAMLGGEDHTEGMNIEFLREPNDVSDR